MKILHIITGLDFGGAERLLVNFTKYHITNHSVEIIYFKGDPRLKNEFDPLVKIHHIPLNFSTASQIRKFIKQSKPDVVHTHLGHADLLGFWACRGLKVKLYCTMHNIWFKWNYKDYFIFALYYLLFKTTARNCKVICISKPVKQHVISTLGVKEENAILVYNGIPNIEINKSKNEIRQLLNIETSAYTVLYVGRLEKQKSIHTLLQAVSELKDRINNLRVIILGDGSLKEDLQQLSRKLGTDNTVEFRGTSMNPELYFAASDIFVLPSIFEGLPTVILEAFRTAIPIIASDIEGPKELIKDGENRLLFEVNNYKRFSELIL